MLDKPRLWNLEVSKTARDRAHEDKVHVSVWRHALRAFDRLTYVDDPRHYTRWNEDVAPIMCVDKRLWRFRTQSPFFLIRYRTFFGIVREEREGKHGTLVVVRVCEREDGIYTRDDLLRLMRDVVREYKQREKANV